MNTTRHSPKREAILECLRSTTCHPSAEWVYAQLKPRIPDLSLATVYRNLARFRAEGTVQVSAVWTARIATTETPHSTGTSSAAPAARSSTCRPSRWSSRICRR